jgi:non-lysosomal glucosylceramidase
MPKRRYASMFKDNTNSDEAKSSLKWPVLTRYDQDHLRKIAMPIGGIGTGTVSLGGRGDLRDWEIVNRPAKGFHPQHSFFTIYTKQEGRDPVTRLLEGIIDPIDFEGPGGCQQRNHGLPRFRNCSFSAAYPFGQVHLSDPDVPVDVIMKAFNPLIPGDADKSGIPAVIIRFELMNKTSEPLSVSVCGCISNFIGMDGKHGAPKKNVNVFKHESGTVSLNGMYLYSEGVDPLSEQYGTMALLTMADDVTYSAAWKGWDIKHSWGEKLLNFWRYFS